MIIIFHCLYFIVLFICMGIFLCKLIIDAFTFACANRRRQQCKFTHKSFDKSKNRLLNCVRCFVRYSFQPFDSIQYDVQHHSTNCSQHDDFQNFARVYLLSLSFVFLFSLCQSIFCSFSNFLHIVWLNLHNLNYFHLPTRTNKHTLYSTRLLEIKLFTKKIIS